MSEDYQESGRVTEETTTAVVLPMAPDIEGVGRPFSPEDLERHLLTLEKGLEVFQRFTITALRYARTSGMLRRVSIDKKSGELVETFEFNGPACESLCTPFGISLSEPILTEEYLEDEKGKYLAVTAMITVTSGMLGRQLTDIGYCDGRDDWLMSQRNVDKGIIKKSAVTNAQVRCVTKLLGLRLPTREMLEEAGLAVDKIKTIDYTGGRTARKPQSSTPHDTPTTTAKAPDPTPREIEDSAKIAEAVQDSDKVTHEQFIQRIKEHLQRLVGEDAQGAKDLLIRLTRYEDETGQWIGEKSHTSKLTSEQAPVVYGKIKKLDVDDVPTLMEAGDWRTFLNMKLKEE